MLLLCLRFCSEDRGVDDMSNKQKEEEDQTEEVIKRMSDLLRNRITLKFERDVFFEELTKVTAQLKQAKAKIASLQKKLRNG